MKEASLEQKVQRALDYLEIQNVMAKHVFYYSAQRQQDELDNIWAKKVPDIAYGHNDGCHVGRESVTRYYAEASKRMRQKKLEFMSQLYPDIENMPDNEGVGDYVVHTLTTPCIEVAADGQTAKGLWYAPSLCAEPGEDGKLVAVNIWEKYGADFIKEDGEWKIWHLRAFVDFMLPLGPDWGDNINRFPGRTVADGMPEHDKQSRPYPMYGHRTVPPVEPGPPEPYDTWDDSMSCVA